MTDFSPNRPHRWPASSVEAFEVYRVGDTDADIREGQDFPKLWAKWHYDWSEPNSVILTIVESDALRAGRLHVADRDAPADGGSAVHGVWEQTSKNLRRPARSHHDAVHRAAVPVVVLQEGLRRAACQLKSLTTSATRRT